MYMFQTDTQPYTLQIRNISAENREKITNTYGVLVAFNVEYCGSEKLLQQ